MYKGTHRWETKKWNHSVRRGKDISVLEKNDRRSVEVLKKKKFKVVQRVVSVSGIVSIFPLK